MLSPMCFCSGDWISPPGGLGFVPTHPALPHCVCFVLQPPGFRFVSSVSRSATKMSRFRRTFAASRVGGNHAYGCPELSEALSLTLEHDNFQNSTSYFPFYCVPLFWSFPAAQSPNKAHPPLKKLLLNWAAGRSENPCRIDTKSKHQSPPPINTSNRPRL